MGSLLFDKRLSFESDIFGLGWYTGEFMLKVEVKGSKWVGWNARMAEFSTEGSSFFDWRKSIHIVPIVSQFLNYCSLLLLRGFLLSIWACRYFYKWNSTSIFSNGV